MTYEKQIADLRRRGVRVQVVRTYKELDAVFHDFLVGHNGYRLPFLILVGQQGTGKTYRLQKAPNIRYINNAVSIVGLFVAVYRCKGAGIDEPDMPMGLDDVDELLTLPGATSFFKALGNDQQDKPMNYEKLNTWLASQGIPNSYTTNSRIALIFNHLPKVGRDLQSVFDRAKIVVFTPSAQEVHQYVCKWFDSQHTDIVDFIGANLDKVYEPSARWYNDALREKRLGNNWRRWLLDVWYDEQPELAIVGDIRRNNRIYGTFNEEAAEFQRRTGLKRASYNLYLRKWKEAQGAGAPAEAASAGSPAV